MKLAMLKIGIGRSPQRCLRDAVLALAAAAVSGATSRAADTLPPYAVTGDAIETPLVDHRPDPARGRSIVVDRQRGLCLLCHSGPFPEERFQGTLAPSLAGTGLRWSAGQLRLRIVDGRRLNPETIMPSYYRIDGAERVGLAWQGKPVLTAVEIEDVVAFLLTLRQPSGEMR